MAAWQQDALAAGLDPDALTTVAALVARGVLDVDGPPIEQVPGFWVIPGFVPYDGHTILTTADRSHAPAGTDAVHELAVILDRAVADGADQLAEPTLPTPGPLPRRPPVR